MVSINPPPPDNADENVWAGAVRKPQKPAGAPVPAKRGTWKKVVIGGAALVVLVFAVLVAAGPSIASAMAPGIIEEQASKSMTGSVKVQDASFSWGGPQVIGPVELLSVDGSSIAQVEVRASAGAWGLLTGYLSGGVDVGQVDVTGKAAIVREASGKTNLEQAVAPRDGAAAPPAEPAPTAEPGVIRLDSMPNIRAKITIRDVDVTYTDAAATAGGTYKLNDFGGDADVDIDQQTGIKAAVNMGTKIASGTGAPADVKLDGRVDIPATGGAARVADASVNAKMSVTDAPVQVLDALAMQEGRLVQALGDTATVEMSVAGDMKNAQATVVANAPRADADLAFNVKDGVLTTARPGHARVQGPSIRALVPAIDQSLANQKLVTVDVMPDVDVQVSSLSIKLPTGGGPLDLRGAGVDLAIKTTETSGTVAVEPGAAPSSFRVHPIDLRVQAQDLAKSAAVALKTSATVNSSPGGDIAVDMTATNLVGPTGEITPQTAAVQGTVAISDLATAIAQPFVEALKIDLPRDVGPELDLKLTANTTPASAGGLPITMLDADVQSQSVRVRASLEMADGMLRTRGDGVTAALATAGTIASRMVDPSTGYELAPSGQANVRVRTLTLPLPKEGQALDLGALAADFDASFAGLSLRPVRTEGPAAAPLEVRTLTASGKIGPSVAPIVNVNGEMSHENQPFTIAAAMEMKGLLVAGAGGKTVVDAKSVRPQGTIELRDVPVSIVKLAPPAKPAADAPVAAGQPGAADAAQAAAKPLDLAALLRGAVGPTATVKVDSVPRGEVLDVAATIAARNLNAELSAGVENKALDVREATAVSTISPQTVQSLVDAFAPQLSQPPRLTDATRATVQVAPIRIPLVEPIFGGFKPDVANAPDATVTVSLPDRTLVQGLALKNADGTTRDLGAVGVEAFQLKATFPPALFAGTSANWTKQASATMSGRVLSGPQEVLLALAGEMNATLSDSAAGKFPVDKLNAAVTLDKVSVGAVERLAAQDQGLISGAVGDTAAVRVNVDLTAPPSAKSFEDAKIDLSAAVQTPRLNIPEPVKLQMLPDRLAIASPIKLTWNVEPAWANRFLTSTPAPGQPAQPASAKLTKPVTVQANVSRLSIARGENVGPLKPGIFGLDAEARIPSVEMVAADGSTVVLDATTIQVAAVSSSQQGGDVIEADIRVAGASVNKQGAAPAQAKDMTMKVGVSSLADPSGQISPKTATVNASGDLPVIPVPLLDALANQDGLMTAALGPVAQATIRAQNLSQTGGSLSVNAKSSRASAVVQGTIRDNVFMTTQPLEVTITEVSPELTQRLLKGVPLIGTITKTPQDQPATVVATDLTVPLDKAFSKLNGNIVVDPGEATIASSGAFTKLLKVFEGKTTGRGGKKIEPLKVNIASGVATYEKWNLPLGEFQVTTEGKVDMVNRTLDVVTWVPVGALTDEAAGLFKAGDSLTKILGPGKDVLDAATTVPWRTKGTFEDNNTRPDLELFAKQVVDKVRPDNLIKRGIEDLLKKPDSGGK